MYAKPPLPAQIGRYRVLEKLGEGGMGVVYAAHDDGLDRKIAVKTIRVTGDATLRDRFWREARAAASVSGSNTNKAITTPTKEGGKPTAPTPAWIAGVSTLARPTTATRARTRRPRLTSAVLSVGGSA